MAKEEAIEVMATVVEALPNAVFSGRAGERARGARTHLGKMRKHFIRILPGDKVLVELSPYDLTRGRIGVPVQMSVDAMLPRVIPSQTRTPSDTRGGRGRRGIPGAGSRGYEQSQGEEVMKVRSSSEDLWQSARSLCGAGSCG